MPGARTAAIAGAGFSDITRGPGRHSTELAVDAVLAALDDAGLRTSDIDGLASYPARVPEDTHWMAVALGLPGLRWYSDVGGWGPAAMSSIGAALAAVESGVCEVAVAYRALTVPERVPADRIDAGRAVTDVQEMFRPYAFTKAPQWMAIWARHHFDTRGTTSEDLGQIAIESRRHASRNPDAIARQPLDMDTYMSSDMISDPLRVFDCDYPVNGAGAVVITTLERARHMARPPAAVRSWSIATGPTPSWVFWPDLDTMAATYAAKAMWERGEGLGPQDVDCFQLYDGFTITAVYWVEAMGLCGIGDGARYLRDNGMDRDSHAPVNTFGGSLSHGRLHGMGHVIEATRQIQGCARGTQLADVEVAAVGVGGGPLAGALLLTSDR